MHIMSVSKTWPPEETSMVYLKSIVCAILAGLGSIAGIKVKPHKR
jgi:hypothetical protein